MPTETVNYNISPNVIQVNWQIVNLLCVPVILLFWYWFPKTLLTINLLGLIWAIYNGNGKDTLSKTWFGVRMSLRTSWDAIFAMWCGQEATPWSLYSLLPALKENEIRLLELVRVFPGSMIYCNNIMTVNVDQANIAYTAISYTWSETEDEPLRDHVIHWGMRQIPITKAGYDALAACLEQSQNFMHHAWIDQICINQTDPIEKSNQIQLMGKIYRRAGADVLIWLSHGQIVADEHDGSTSASSGSCYTREDRLDVLLNSETPPSIDDIQIYGKLNEHTDDAIYGAVVLIQKLHMAYGASLNRWELESLPHLKLVLNNQRAWTTLRQIFNHRYFRRRWVIQESGQRPATVCMIGKCTIQLRCLRNCLSVLDKCRNGCFPELARHLNMSFVDQILDELPVQLAGIRAMSAIQWRSTADQSIPLCFLLDICRISEYSDPRDMFYALRSMASDVERLPEPDYTKTTYEIFNQHVACLLELGYGPTMIQRAGLINGRQLIQHGEKGSVALPTWCPAWCPTDPTMLPHRYFLDLNESRFGFVKQDGTETIYHGFRASSGRADIKRIDDNNLELSGNLIGNIIDLAPNVLEHVHLSHLPNLDLNYQNLALKFQLVTTRNRSWVQEKGSFHKLPLWLQNYMINWREIPILFVHYTKWYNEKLTVYHPFDYLVALHYMPEEYMECGPMVPTSALIQFNEFLPHRQLAAVQCADGVVIGYVPRVAEIGDVVTVFDGCQVPMVIRFKNRQALSSLDTCALASEEVYEVIGDAHFMQYANGEAARDPSLTRKSFILM